MIEFLIALIELVLIGPAQHFHHLHFGQGQQFILLTFHRPDHGRAVTRAGIFILDPERAVKTFHLWQCLTA